MSGTLAIAALSVASAFQAPFLGRSQLCHPSSSASNAPCVPFSTRLFVSASVADPDLRMLAQPPADRVPDPPAMYVVYDDEMNLSNRPEPPEMFDTAKVKFKSIAMSPGKVRRTGGGGGGGDSRITTTTKPPSSRSRSSTMPGFATQSDRQRAYREGIRLVERRTGKVLREDPEARQRRRRENGDAMYRNSASVPDSLVQFAEEIHQEDRITRLEEIELGEKTQEALRLQTLYENLETKLDREPTDEEWCAAAGKINMEAICQAINDGIDAKNKLVTSNLRMVQSVVNAYIRNGLSGRYNAGDMMQEGILALIRAAEKFEPDRGWKFSTYAMYWVRASVKRSQILQSRIIPVPQRLYENHKRLLRIERDLYGALGRKPTKKELGKVVGMSEVQVERCFTAMEQSCVSLDQTIRNTLKPNSGDRDSDTLVEIVDAKFEDIEQHRQRVSLVREALIETLNRHLKPDEVELLMLRYGLKEGPSNLSGQQLSIAELSRLVDRKPDKVRRTITRCLKQLKAIGVEEWLAFERELS